jgi:hypothetical protein
MARLLALFLIIAFMVIVALWCRLKDTESLVEGYRKELADTYHLAAQANIQAQQSEDLLRECVRRGHLRLVQNHEAIH